MPSGSCDNARLMCCLISCNCSARVFRSSHGFSVTKKNRVVARAHETQQTESDNACRVLHARRFRQDVFNLSRDRIRPLQRRRIRQLQIDVQDIPDPHPAKSSTAPCSQKIPHPPQTPPSESAQSRSCESIHRRTRTYPFVTLANVRLNHPKNLFNKPAAFLFRLQQQRRQAPGSASTR